MTTPVDWIEASKHRTDQSCWDEYVMVSRTWEEDFYHHSAHNVLHEILTHRGILPANTQDVVWEIIEALFPNSSPVKGAILKEIGDHPARMEAAKDVMARALTGAKNRGTRIAQGFFVHTRGQPERLYKEMRVLDPIMAMTQAALQRQSLLTEGFARAFIDTTGLQPHEAELVVNRGIATRAVGEQDATVWNEKLWFQKREA